MGDGLLGLGTGPFRRRSISVDVGLSGSMTLQTVVDHMREGVLAREIKIEGFRASGRAEDAPYTAAPYKAAAPNPSAQRSLRILTAAHFAARGRCRWSVGLLALPSEIGAGP